MLRAADRYAYTDCGSTACSVGTVYGGKGHLYTPGVCPGLLATPCIASLAMPHRLAGDHLAPHWRSPYASLAITLCLTGDHLVDDALLALLGLTTETRPTHNTPPNARPIRYAPEIHKNKRHDRERCMPARDVRLEEMYAWKRCTYACQNHDIMSVVAVEGST